MNTKTAEGIQATIDSTVASARLPDRTVITTPMERSEWAAAKANFESKTTGPVSLGLAKNNTVSPYRGQVLYITDTHIVQRVNANVAVVHEFSKLTNGADLNAAVDNGKLKPGSQLEVSYAQDHGRGDVVPFNRLRAEIVQREVTEWAKENIKAPKALDTFLKTMEKATLAISADRTPKALDTKGPEASIQKLREVAPTAR